MSPQQAAQLDKDSLISRVCWNIQIQPNRTFTSIQMNMLHMLHSWMVCDVMLQPRWGLTFMTSVQLCCVQCVLDSTKLFAEMLRNIEQGPEMLQPVQPLGSSSPLIFRHHSYTHISVDPSQHSRDFQVLFLSLREYSSSTWWRRLRKWGGVGEVEVVEASSDHPTDVGSSPGPSSPRGSGEGVGLPPVLKTHPPLLRRFQVLLKL